MDSNTITPAQAGALRLIIIQHLGYLGRLRERMEKTGFPPDDRLYRAVVVAWDATQRLAVDLHYLSCKHGVGMALSAKTWADGQREDHSPP